MRLLPRYNVLVSNYPDKHHVSTKTLLDSIGGDVRRTLSDQANTCALRMSDALNRCGQPIQSMTGVFQMLGGTPRPIAGRPLPKAGRYIIRVPDMKRYLEKEYGLGKLICDATKQPGHTINLTRQTQGIIVFVWSGVFREFGASGHVDLFRLVPNGENPPRLQAECEGQCYWWPQGGPMKAYLWETTP